jgi:hypothetical protein
MLIDLNDMNVSSIPIKLVYDMLGKLSLYYCGFSDKIIIYNSKGLGFIWTLINRFLPEHAKNKIMFV